MTTPPYTPRHDDDWPEQIAELQGGFATQLNVYRTMAHNPALLKAWAPLRQHVVKDTALGAELSEVAILRTGHRLGSPYEWSQHVYRARSLGMSDSRINKVRGPLEGMRKDDATIARAVDELFYEKRLSPHTQSALVGLVGTEGMFDLIATVGFYSTLGYILNSFDTPLDDDVAQALQETPFDP